MKISYIGDYEGTTISAAVSPSDAQCSSSVSKAGSRRLFGRPPWHRTNSQEDRWSITSSVRDVLMGKTPLATPVPEAQYIGPNGTRYPKGESFEVERCC